MPRPAWFEDFKHAEVQTFKFIKNNHNRTTDKTVATFLHINADYEVCAINILRYKL